MHLAELIDAKLAVLVELQFLSGRQAAAIDDSDLSALLQILAGKQQLVTQLQRIDSQIAAFQEHDAPSHDWPSPEARQRCREQAARCETLLREILLAERQAEEQMVLRRGAAAERLATVNQAAQAQLAYVQPTFTRPLGSLDLTSER